MKTRLIHMKSQPYVLLLIFAILTSIFFTIPGVRSAEAALSPSFDPAANTSVGAAPTSVAVGDFNGDGCLDLATANMWADTVSVVLNNSDGTFPAKHDYAVGNSPMSVASGDFNGDGSLDLASGSSSEAHTVSILLNNGDGTFPAVSPVCDLGANADPIGVTVGDFNDDGSLDLATANYGWTSTVSILLGNGDGTFAAKLDYPVGSATWSIAAGDFDGDGILDLATVNSDWNTVSVLLGNGNGTIAASICYTVGSSPQSITVGDFNGDGKPDLAAANMDADTVSVLLNNGDGSFPAVSPAYNVNDHPYGVTVGDFNSDGSLDLAAASYGSHTVSILLNNGDGTFPAVSLAYNVNDYPYGVAVGDFNSDGRLDLVTANSGSHTVSVLINKTVPPALTTPVATPATGIGPSGFTANWNAVPDATHYHIDVATDAGFSNTVPAYNGLYAGNSGLVAVTGLNPNTAYYYRVWAENNSLISLRSYWVKVTTAALPVQAAPVVTAATGVGSSGFTANWNMAAGATHYHLTVATDAAFTLPLAAYNELDLGNVTSAPVAGLSANTPYYYRLRADSGISSSIPSNVITVTTAPPGTVPAPNPPTDEAVSSSAPAPVTNSMDFTVEWASGELSLPSVDSRTFASPVYRMNLIGIAAINGGTRVTLPFDRDRYPQSSFALCLCYFDTGIKQWKECANSEVDWERGNVSGKLDKVARFAVLAAPTEPASAALPLGGTIPILIDGTALTCDVPPLLENGRVLVPMRAIFEALGANLVWDANNQIAQATRGDTVVTLQLGSNTANINYQPVLLDAMPQVMTDRILVPLRFVSEALGAEVIWHDDSRSVEITTR